MRKLFQLSKARAAKSEQNWTDNDYDFFSTSQQHRGFGPFERISKRIFMKIFFSQVCTHDMKFFIFFLTLRRFWWWKEKKWNLRNFFEDFFAAVKLSYEMLMLLLQRGFIKTNSISDKLIWNWRTQRTSSVQKLKKLIKFFHYFLLAMGGTFLMNFRNLNWIEIYQPQKENRIIVRNGRKKS